MKKILAANKYLHNITSNLFIYFFFNWDSLNAKLSNHYKAWNYKKKKHKKIEAHQKSL